MDLAGFQENIYHKPRWIEESNRNRWMIFMLRNENATVDEKQFNGDLGGESWGYFVLLYVLVHQIHN